MRYFFNIITASQALNDLEGMELADEQSAQAQGHVISREMAREFPGQSGKALVVEVVAADGRRVLALPVASVSGQNEPECAIRC